MKLWLIAAICKAWCRMSCELVALAPSHCRLNCQKFFARTQVQFEYRIVFIIPSREIYCKWEMQTSECTTVLWALCACIVWHSISVEDNNFLAPASLYLIPWRQKLICMLVQVAKIKRIVVRFFLHYHHLPGWHNLWGYR